MVEVPFQTQIVTGVINIIVFYFLIKKTKENLNSTKDTGVTP